MSPFDRAMEVLRLAPPRVIAARDAGELASGSGPSPVASISEERRCECCKRKLRKNSRPERRTCSHRCRQKLWRKSAKTREASRQLSRKPAVARHVLSSTARSRAALPVDAEAVPLPTETSHNTRRAIVSGRITRQGVQID